MRKILGPWLSVLFVLVIIMAAFPVPVGADSRESFQSEMQKASDGSGTLVGSLRRIQAQVTGTESLKTEPKIRSQAVGFPDPAYEAVWNRTDKPVAEQQAARTWMWGPNILDVKSEGYLQSPGGARQTVYFDKSRMEITNTGGDRGSQWFVTNGLLVKELISGKVQMGDNNFVDRWPSQQTVAGDPPQANPNGLTYASLQSVANINGDKRAPDRTGQPVVDWLYKLGDIRTDPPIAGMGVKVAAYNQELGHNIPNVFWDYFNQQGTIYQDGKFVKGQVIDWVFAAGFPLTEPYWTNVKVGGVDTLVLVQAFQRRILTYTPANPDGWKVEMGNVGRHYYDWRYTEDTPVPDPLPTPPPPPPPSPSPSPSPNPNPNPGVDVDAAVAPTSGPAGCLFIFDAWGFQPGEPVTVFAVRPDNTRFEPSLQTSAGSDGALVDYVVLQTVKESRQGRWHFVAQGAKSGKNSVAYFQVTPPRDATINITPRSGTTWTEFTVDAYGFVPDEPLFYLFGDPEGTVWEPQEQTLVADGNGEFHGSFVPGDIFPYVVRGQWEFGIGGVVSGVVGTNTFTITR